MEDLREKYLSLISGATDEASLENLRVQAVGKKGEISLRMRSLGKMTPEERQDISVAPAFGPETLPIFKIFALSPDEDQAVYRT